MSTRSNRVWLSWTSWLLTSLAVGPAVGRAEQPATAQASSPITAIAFIAPRLWLREFADDPAGPIAAAAFGTEKCLTGRRTPIIGLARDAEDPLRRKSQPRHRSAVRSRHYPAGSPAGSQTTCTA